MAAYAAALSLEPRINRHLNKDDPSYLLAPPTVFVIMQKAREQIESTREALQVLDRDNSLGSWTRIRTWQLVEPHLLNQFPFEYAIAQFAYNGPVLPLFNFLGYAKVDVSDIGRVRDVAAACGLQHVLESLLSSLRLKQQQQQQILAELNTANQQIRSFTQMVEKIITDGNKSKNMVPLRDEFPQIRKELIPEIKKHGDKMLTDIEEVIQRLNYGSRERVSVVEVQIREALYEIEDLLDTRLTDQFPVPFPMDLNEVQKHIPPFTQLLGKLKQEYINELIRPSSPDEDGDDIISLRKSYGKNKSKMVGLSDEVAKTTTLLNKPWPLSLKIVQLFGMGGIGKTTVAEQVFDDPSVLERFELRAWVEVGQNHQLRRIKESILAQVMISRPDIYLDEILTDERLDEYLHEVLKGRRYLIVLDDVWDIDYGFWDRMIGQLFPDDGKYGSRVLLTTRCRFSSLDRDHMRFMNKEESWELLCEKVFGDESLCPPLLKSAGKTIAESCEGLPLTIVTVAELLSRVKRTPEKWNELADNRNSLIKEAYDQMSKVLLPSYNYLTQKLKAAFLYMGVFTCKYEISLSELLKLWVTEKIPNKDMSPIYLRMIVEDLRANSLLIMHEEGFRYGIKTWSLHSSIWHLCKREAIKNKFSYVVECFDDSLSEDIKNQRRLCVHKNILFGIKDVHKSMASISTARSLLCTGPPHQYPVPICFDLKLLRILNALTIRLYEFPLQVFKLFQLNYLALTCYGNLPSTISKLGNLQILIIRRHISIGSSRAMSYLPMEIWDMKELTHLQVMGSDLPSPCEGTFFPNLQTLLDASTRSCNKFVLEGTPNLKKLGIQIELTPDGHSTETSHCFNHIYLLKKLESLKCVVVNPTFGSHVTPPTLPVFPSSLIKLSLSGFGYPWEDMRLIASLPKLRNLKLRCYAFRGPKLEMKDNGFPVLGSLLIEDTDLVNWTIEHGSLSKILKILLKRCYKLENKHKFTKLVDCYKLENDSKRL